MYRHDKSNYKFKHNIALNLITVYQDSLIEDLNNVTYYWVYVYCKTNRYDIIF